MDPTDAPNRRNKPKTVRWPESYVAGRGAGDSDAGEGTASQHGSSLPSSSSALEEEDYFSYHGGSGSRRQQMSDSNHYDSDGSEHDVRATTRANTWFNRQPSSDDIPRLHVTPVGDESSPPNLPPGLHAAHFNPYSGILDVGTVTSGGLAPGGATRPEDGIDNDPLDREYRRRRDTLLAKIHVGSRSQPSTPDMPAVHPAEDDDGSIPMIDLPPRHRREISNSSIMSTPSASEADAGNNSGDISAYPSAANSIISGPDDTHPKEGGEEDEDEDEERRKARLEAEELARELVKVHAAPEKGEARGYIPEDQYFLDQQLIDEDFARDLEDHQQALEQNAQTDDNNGSELELGSVEKEKDQDSVQEGDDNVDRTNEAYVPPGRVKEGVLGSLLRLYGQQDDAASIKTGQSGMTSPSPGSTPLMSPMITPSGTPSETPGSTPPELPPGSYSQSRPSSIMSSSDKKKWKRPAYLRTQSTEDALGRATRGKPKWYSKSKRESVSLSQLAASSLGAVTAPAHAAASSAAHAAHAAGAQSSHYISQTAHRPFEDRAERERREIKKMKKKLEQQRAAEAKRRKKAKMAEQMRITVHIADVLQRQRFILRLGRALMLFGAPTHRLEEYLRMTARVLEIDGQFLYMPGCMLVSFGDATTHTSETKLLRVTQGLNLTKLDATHLVYKEVVHDIMGLEEASTHIDNLLSTKNLYPWWLVCIFYGCATASIAMFSFGGYWQDIPLTFLIGGGVGFLQNWVQPRSDLYANVFEVTSSIVVSFTGRAFGSIWKGKHRLFCFAAIVQGSLALILPGYIILCGSLELQSRNLVAGSVRMFYATIYSLFLSFGITLGSAIYGWIDTGAVDEVVCWRSLSAEWKILFVPLASMFMAMVNQANFRQLPVMVFIASSGYTVLYFVQQHVDSASAFSSAIGAFTIGILGNLYSRIGHGLAFAAMLPGIFIIVPSGVAAQGSLVSGIEVAQQIVSKNSSSSDDSTTTTGSTSVTDLGNTMTQVAVGITVGLFAATLVVYPLGLGKKRSGLFTF